MESRKRLYHWLKEKVEAGECGLKWLNKDEQIFSIPWMHCKNKNWTEEKGRIFKEWALFTKSYKEEEKDYTRWKTNLRAALHKLSNFQELPDQHLRSELCPYRVYRFVTDETDKQSSPQCINESTNSSQLSNQQNEGASFVKCIEPPPSQYDVRPPSFDALSSPSQNESANLEKGNTSNMLGSSFRNLSETCAMQTFSNALGCSETQNKVTIPNFFNTAQYQQMEVNSLFEQLETFSKRPDVFDNPNPSDLGNECQESSMDTNSAGVPSDLPGISDLSSARLPSDEMAEIKKDPDSLFYRLYYFGEVVKVGVVSGNGAHFHFGNLPNFDAPTDLFGPKDLEREKLPNLSDTYVGRRMTPKQQESINFLLSKIDRGFLLGSSEGNIYVRRMCLSRLYAKTFKNENLHIERKRQGEIKVFDLNDFKASNTKSPLILLSFGTNLCSSDTVKNLFVSMEIVPVKPFMDMVPSAIQEFKSPNSVKRNSCQCSIQDSWDVYIDMLKSLKMI